MHTVPFNHVRGSTAFFVVADGTREQTLDTALRLREEALRLLGDVPCLLLLNKVDAKADWQISDERLATLQTSGLAIVKTSAKSCTEVEAVFEELARALLA